MKNIVSIVDNDVMLEKAGESLNSQPTITRFRPFSSTSFQSKNIVCFFRLWIKMDLIYKPSLGYKMIEKIVEVFL